jgi:hypothetical protein
MLFDFVPVPSVPSGDSILIIDMTFVSYLHGFEAGGLSWETECVFGEVAISRFSLGSL